MITNVERGRFCGVYGFIFFKIFLGERHDHLSVDIVRGKQFLGCVITDLVGVDAECISAQEICPIVVGNC